MGSETIMLGNKFNNIPKLPLAEHGMGEIRSICKRTKRTRMEGSGHYELCCV